MLDLRTNTAAPQTCYFILLFVSFALKPAYVLHRLTRLVDEWGGHMSCTNRILFHFQLLFMLKI